MSIQFVLHLLQVCFHFSFFHCIQSLPTSYPLSKNSLTHHPLNEIPYLYSKRRGDEKHTQENHALYILDNYLHNWNAFFSLFFSKEIPKNKKAYNIKDISNTQKILTPWYLLNGPNKCDNSCVFFQASFKKHTRVLRLRQPIFHLKEQERLEISFQKGKTHSWLTLTIFISSSFPTILWGNVHQLQNKGSPGDNSSTSWEQIPPHKTFQHRTLSTALKSRI